MSNAHLVANLLAVKVAENRPLRAVSAGATVQMWSFSPRSSCLPASLGTVARPRELYRTGTDSVRGDRIFRVGFLGDWNAGPAVDTRRRGGRRWRRGCVTRRERVRYQYDGRNCPADQIGPAPK